MVYVSEDQCESRLGKKIQYWRAERPDEWTMDEFIRDAEIMASQLDEALDMLDDGARTFLLDKWKDA